MREVRCLRLLRELAAHGTIAAVAQACSLTPSAVSQQLALLEREVRIPLLVRDGRRLMLTEAAHVLVAHTEVILTELEAAAADVAALDASVRGTLRLVSFPSAAGALAAPAIAEVRRAHPGLRILLDEREPDDAVGDVRAHRVDTALVYEYNLLPRLTDPAVRLRPLVRGPLLLALPPNSFAHLPDEPCVLADFSEQRWIAPTSDSTLREVLVRACQTAGFDPQAPTSDSTLREVLVRACQTAGFDPQLDYTSDDFTVILALMQAGLGDALVPRLPAEQLPAEVELRPVADLELTRSVSVAVRTGSAGNPAIAALLEALGTAAGAADRCGRDKYLSDGGRWACRPPTPPPCSPAPPRRSRRP